MRAFALVAVMLSSAIAAAQGPSSDQDPQPVDPYRDQAPAAEPATPSPLSLDDVPVACAAQAKAAKAATPGAVTAKVAVATCTASQKLSGLQLIDAEASVQEVEQAIDPSLALLELVIDTNDPGKQILAYHAGGDILMSAVTRMRATVPAGELHDMRAQMLEPLLKPWLERAQTAFTQVDKVARQHPELLKNQVVANAVKDSQQRLTALR